MSSNVVPPPPAPWGAGLSFVDAQRWAALARPAYAEITEALLAAADLRPGLRVLDEACGQGMPALDEARRVAPGGSVVAFDLSEPAIALARQFAETERATNISFQTGDALALPFPDGAFDRVTCRFGAMFFPDLGRALTEARRVLGSGGRLAWMAWGPLDENDFFRATARVAQRHAGLASLSPDGEQPFRFARGGLLRAAAERVGFTHVEERAVQVSQSWAASPEQVAAYFWDYPPPPFKSMIASLTPSARTAAVAETVAEFRAKSHGGTIRLAGAVRVLSARV